MYYEREGFGQVIHCQWIVQICKNWKQRGLSVLQIMENMMREVNFHRRKTAVNSALVHVDDIKMVGDNTKSQDVCESLKVERIHQGLQGYAKEKQSVLELHSERSTS